MAGKLTDASTSRVVDGVNNRGTGAANAQFADPTCLLSYPPAQSRQASPNCGIAVIARGLLVD